MLGLWSVQEESCSRNLAFLASVLTEQWSPTKAFRFNFVLSQTRTRHLSLTEEHLFQLVDQYFEWK